MDILWCRNTHTSVPYRMPAQLQVTTSNYCRLFISAASTKSGLNILEKIYTKFWLARFGFSVYWFHEKFLWLFPPIPTFNKFSPPPSLLLFPHLFFVHCSPFIVSFAAFFLTLKFRIETLDINVLSNKLLSKPVH